MGTHKIIFDEEEVNEEHYVPKRTQVAWALNLGVLPTLSTNSLVLVSVYGRQGKWIGNSPRPPSSKNQAESRQTCV